MIKIELTQQEFDTIRNIIDFVASHAADGMSPAMNDGELIEHAATQEEADLLYDEQQKRLNAVRRKFNLDVEDSL